jgi:hypothetical protein
MGQSDRRREGGGSGSSGGGSAAPSKHAAVITSPDRATKSGHPGRLESGGQSVATSDVLTHMSDSQIKPIVNNKAIETIEKHSLSKTSSMHFQPMTLEQLSSLSQSKIESHLSQVLIRVFTPCVLLCFEVL